MKRYDIIKKLIEKNNYQSYLEIGVLDNETFNNLPNLKIKDSVDPNGQAKYTMTSDEYFASHCTNTYDIVFIDGLHLAEQVLKDIENSLSRLNKGGIIVVHDCLPNYEWEQIREGISGRPWTGDVWKTFADLRYRDDLKMCVVNTDCGCGLIQKESSINLPEIIKPIEGWQWNHFVLYKDSLLNVISIKQFVKDFVGE